MVMLFDIGRRERSFAAGCAVWRVRCLEWPYTVHGGGSYSILVACAACLVNGRHTSYEQHLAVSMVYAVGSGVRQLHGVAYRFSQAFHHAAGAASA